LIGLAVGLLRPLLLTKCVVGAMEPGTFVVTITPSEFALFAGLSIDSVALPCGADETGADETGADETGADETGADETGDSGFSVGGRAGRHTGAGTGGQIGDETGAETVVVTGIATGTDPPVPPTA
jgi:hypothetical protein